MSGVSLLAYQGERRFRISVLSPTPRCRQGTAPMPLVINQKVYVRVLFSEPEPSTLRFGSLLVDGAFVRFGENG
jgi:hypothetical protein